MPLPISSAYSVTRNEWLAVSGSRWSIAMESTSIVDSKLRLTSS